MRYILSSDQHLRSYVPVCRVEERDAWLQFQFERLCEVVVLANTYDADLIIGGDLFDSPRIEDEVITLFLRAMKMLTGKVHIIGGNHSLPNHREANIDASSLGVVVAASEFTDGKIQYHVCKEELIDGRFQHSYRLNDFVTIIHTLAFEKEEDVPFMAKATSAEALLGEFDTPWLFVGDLHMHYHARFGERHVLSSGCLTAQTVREKDEELGVYFVDTGTLTDVTVQADKEKQYRVGNWEVKWLPIFHDPALVSTAHLREKPDDEALQSMRDAFSGKDQELSVDYVRNLDDYIIKNKVSLGASGIMEEIKEVQRG